MKRFIFLFFILCGLLTESCSKNDSPINEPPKETPGTDNKDDNDDKEDHSNGLKVLCLGNSITRHEYAPSIEWFSAWGMAASKEENDYCHQLERMLCQQRPSSKVTPLNIADWERNLSMNLNTLLDQHCKDKDVIVIRLGENVADKTAFKTAIGRLVSYCKKQAKHVFITGCFWKDDEKEAAIKQAATAYGIPYVDLRGIDQVGVTRPSTGDILYDLDGKPYTITKDFIIAHPNDKGMKRIAEEIMKAFLLHIKDDDTAPSYAARSFTLDNPQTFVFLPASHTSTGRAVVVCPGGGYGYCEPEDNYEGNGWASFFNERGIALIVVKYTLPAGNCQLPIADAETTIKRVREHAKEWYVNIDDGGIMGFSAGGHLASTIATHSIGDAHPNFQILFYPVITMGAQGHAWSRENFLGKNPSTAQMELYSNEKQVKTDTPRAFITFTEDDTEVPPTVNGKAYYQALINKGIPAKLVSWQSSNGWGAGHGWGNLGSFVHHEELMSQLSDWLKSF